MEERSFVVRFVLVCGRAAVRVTEVASRRQWLIADPEELRALERVVRRPAVTGKEL